MNFWDQPIFTIGHFTLTPGRILVLTAIFFGAWLLLFILKKIIIKKYTLKSDERGRKSSLYQLLKYFISIIAICLAINTLGFDITILVAGSAALLVGLGFGLQNIFSDLVSGIFLLFERKVKVGDIMEVDGIVGKVEGIDLRTSVLLTRDGYNIIVPNHKFITDNVINWSHQSLYRRFQVEVGVSYQSDIELVTKLLLDCAEEQEELIKDERHVSEVRFQSFGESSLIFSLLFWTNDVFKAEQVKSVLRYRIFHSFLKNNIVIPFPQRDIHIIQA